MRRGMGRPDVLWLDDGSGKVGFADAHVSESRHGAPRVVVVGHSGQAVWRLVADSSLAVSSQTDSSESAKRLEPASRIAESGTLWRVV